MSVTDAANVPHCRDDPPWTDCGDPEDPDFGLVFARRVANGAVALFFDRAGLRRGLTLFNAINVGAEVVIYGRRFSVGRVTAG